MMYPDVRWACGRVEHLQARERATGATDCNHGWRSNWAVHIAQCWQHSWIQKATQQLYIATRPYIHLMSGYDTARGDSHQASQQVTTGRNKHWGGKAWVRGYMYSSPRRYHRVCTKWAWMIPLNSIYLKVASVYVCVCVCVCVCCVCVCVCACVCVCVWMVSTPHRKEGITRATKAVNCELSKN